MTIGHNGGPPLDKLTQSRRNKRLWDVLKDETLTAAQKCVGVSIILAAEDDWSSQVTTRELQIYASARDRETVFRATKALAERGIVERSSQRGQPGSYKVLPAKIVEAIKEAYDELRSGRHEPDHFTAEQSASTRPDVGNEPVGLNRTTSEVVGMNPTSQESGRHEPDRINPTSPVEPDQSSRAYIYNNTNTLEDSKNLDTRKGGVGENLPFDALPETEPEKPKRAKPRPKPTTEQFEKFWDAYPLRKGKPKALERFMALTPDQADQAIAGARLYADECIAENREAKHIKYPQGWLSDRRFVDYAESDQTSGQNYENLMGPNGKRWGWWRAPAVASKLKSLSVEYWRDGIENAKPNGTWPWWLLTAPPGHDECLVPEELQTPLIEIYRGKIHHA